MYTAARSRSSSGIALRISMARARSVAIDSGAAR
jgi:hypothetical protein